MRSSYWKFCIPGPDGEEICTELYAQITAEFPPILDGQIKNEIIAFAGVEAATSQVTDATLQAQLIETLDDAAVRLNTLLPGGAVLRRTNPDTFDDDPKPFAGVPYVVGMTHADGFNTLRAAGYQVKTVWEWTSPSEEGTVTDQSPPGYADNAPPTLVYIWIRTLPPDPPDSTDPVVIEIPE